MTPPLRSVAGDDPLPEAVDVVVIGGGIAGATAARELALRGSSVALLEKGRFGAEQSCRNWGWCRQQNRDEREIPLSQLALRLWGTLAEETGQDLGFRRSGLVFATNEPADLAAWEEWSKMAAGYGVDSRVLTGAELQGLLPGTTRSWLGGIQAPTDGRAEPGLAAPILAGDARRHGATLHQTCAARELDISAGRVTGVITEKGRIRCDAVLIAGGVWAGQLLRHHGHGFLQASVTGTSFFTEPAAEISPGGVAMQDVTFRRRIDGGYTVGLSNWGKLSFTPWGIRQARPFLRTFLKRRHKLSYAIGRSFFDGPEAMCRWTGDSVSPFERMRTLDPAPNPKLVERGLRGLEEAYPALRGIRVAQSWGGQIDVTPDAIPVIGPVLSQPGLFVSAGFSGHGFGIGPGAGRLAAELVRGDAPSVDPAPFRYERMIDGTDLGAMGMM